MNIKLEPLSFLFKPPPASTQPNEQLSLSIPSNNMPSSSSPSSPQQQQITTNSHFSSNPAAQYNYNPAHHHYHHHHHHQFNSSQQAQYGQFRSQYQTYVASQNDTSGGEEYDYDPNESVSQNQLNCDTEQIDENDNDILEETNPQQQQQQQMQQLLDSKQQLVSSNKIRKRSANQAYEYLTSLADSKTFQDWLSSNETDFTWVHKRNSMTNAGKKYYYICNYRIKKGYVRCPAVIYALFPNNNDSTVMVYSCGEHEHRRLNGTPPSSNQFESNSRRNGFSPQGGCGLTVSNKSTNKPIPCAKQTNSNVKSNRIGNSSNGSSSSSSSSSSPPLSNAQIEDEYQKSNADNADGLCDEVVDNNSDEEEIEEVTALKETSDKLEHSKNTTSLNIYTAAQRQLQEFQHSMSKAATPGTNSYLIAQALAAQHNHTLATSLLKHNLSKKRPFSSEEYEMNSEAMIQQSYHHAHSHYSTTTTTTPTGVHQHSPHAQLTAQQQALILNHFSNNRFQNASTSNLNSSSFQLPPVTSMSGGHLNTSPSSSLIQNVQNYIP